MNDETLSGVLGDPEREQGARERDRLRKEDEERQRQAVELKAEEQEDQGRGDDEDRREARERFLLRPVVPGQLEAIAGRET